LNIEPAFTPVTDHHDPRGDDMLDATGVFS